MNPLTSIPSRVRVWLYWAGYLLGVASQGVTIVWGAIAAASPDVEMPTWLIVASAVVAFAQTQLNLLAGSNVTDVHTTTTTAPADAEITTRVTLGEDGHGDSGVLLVVSLLLLAVCMVWVYAA